MHRFAIVLLAGVIPLCAAIPEPIQIETGKLTGVPGVNPEVRVFKGIPFAAPPTGELRWRAPKPAAKWEGARTAGEFSAPCMQRAGNNAQQRPMSEDCLYLNVYTAAGSPTDRRPVTVWIHGGALTSGTASIYNGEELAKKGVVVVTVNYRLGVFGFFAHPELTKESDRNASGNYGLLDQIAALEWVRRNIAAFGGDPQRVTIFGESAGSWCTNMLMASPLARGLFQRVIGESGAEFAHVDTLAEAERAGEKFAKSVNADSLAALRAKSAADLQAAGGSAGPNVDGYALPEDVYTIFAKGKQNDVPLLIGSNADEGTMFTPAATTLTAFSAFVKQRFGADADEITKLYPAQNDDEAKSAVAALIRDQMFGWEMRTWARMQNATGKSKVYVYFFSRVPPGATTGRLRGAYHSAEITYAFNNVNGKLNPQQRAWEDVDRKLADTMSSYWVNFATTGDPNGKGLPQWPAYREKDDRVMGFGDKVELIPLPHKPELDEFDRVIEKRRHSGAAASN